MIFLKIFIGVIRMCKNWPRLLAHRILAKTGINPTFLPVDAVSLRNGTVFSTGRRRALGAADLFLVWEIWLKQCYFIPGSDFMVHEGDIVLDIGANKGYFTVFAANQHKAGKVFSFEPAPDNYRYLLENLKLNQLNNVVTEPKAITNSKGTMKLYLAPDNEGGHSLYSTTGQPVEVQTITLEEYCRDKNIDKIDFLKIDCEGAEYGILKSIPDELYAKIGRISMEHHKISGHDPKELVELLKAKDFEILEFNDTYLKAIKRGK